MKFLDYPRQDSVMVFKEVGMFRLKMNDWEQVQYWERMSAYHDLVGGLQ